MKKIIYISIGEFLFHGGKLEKGIPIYTKNMKDLSIFQIGVYKEFINTKDIIGHFTSNTTFKSFPITETAHYVAIEVNVDVKNILIQPVNS